MSNVSVECQLPALTGSRSEGNYNEHPNLLRLAKTICPETLSVVVGHPEPEKKICRHF